MAELASLWALVIVAGFAAHVDIGSSGPYHVEFPKELNSTGNLRAGKLQLPAVASNCKWTGCEGKTRFGVDICKEYGAGRYTGNTNYEGCNWTNSRVECCKPLPPGTVKWSARCYGIAYGGNWVCGNEYGPEFRGTGSKKACSSITYQWQCKN